MGRRGPQKQKDYLILQIRCEKSVMDKLEHYCDVVGQSKTKAVEIMLDTCLDQWQKIDEADKRIFSKDSFRER